MRVLLGIVIGILLVAVAGLVYMYSGAYDVAATVKHNPVVGWVLDTTRERSVEVRGERVAAPPSFTDTQVSEGLHQFKETCIYCHGAPGVEPSAIGKGLNPKPPSLADEAKELSNGELFWVVKHGIKMTGMPSFGVTRNDDEIWAIVAFLDRLKGLTPETYQKMAEGLIASKPGQD
jgi:mono/diheme cytochrome c family protein